MPFLTDQIVPQNANRIYHAYVPANPPGPTVPAIIVFHGAGQDARTIARRWGLVQGRPVPANVENYLLVFPEADFRLSDAWVHYKQAYRIFPTLDLEFVDLLIDVLTNTSFATGSMLEPTIRADPELVYAAGFSSGGGMVWQLMNSDLVDHFQAYAAVGMPLLPEKAARYRSELEASGAVPPAVPVIYVHGTADGTFRGPTSLTEVPLETTFPSYTVQEMLCRNGIPACRNDILVDAPAATTLVTGSTDLTEVVVQEFTGGAAAFTAVTVINGGHNWPGPGTHEGPDNQPVATHFDATQAILDFWIRHAGLPYRTSRAVGYRKGASQNLRSSR